LLFSPPLLSGLLAPFCLHPFPPPCLGRTHLGRGFLFCIVPPVQLGRFSLLFFSGISAGKRKLGSSFFLIHEGPGYRGRSLALAGSSIVSRDRALVPDPPFFSPPSFAGVPFFPRRGPPFLFRCFPALHPLCGQFHSVGGVCSPFTIGRFQAFFSLSTPNLLPRKIVGGYPTPFLSGRELEVPPPFRRERSGGFSLF